MKIIHPQKRHDGKLIHIRALPGAKVKEQYLAGFYEHIPNSTGFWLERTDPFLRGYKNLLLDRKDWKVV